jgi:dolichol-phosphate mannosyltransferase
MLSRNRNRHTSCEVAIVIPTLNEGKAMGDVIDGIREAMQQYDHEIVIVDGHSTDNTIDVSMQKGATIIYQRENGYGGALQTGFNHVYDELKAPITVMMDADLTYDPKEMPQLIEPILKGEADFVIGNRFRHMEKGAMSLTNRVGNRILSWVVKKMLDVKVCDTQCGFRAFRTEILQNVDFRNSGMSFATEMLVEAKEAKARIAEVCITYRRRIGETKLSPFKDGVQIFGTILRLIRDYKPLLFFGGFGLILSLIGLLIGVNVVSEWIQSGSITHLASVSLSSTLIITGFFVFMIGLLADMIKSLRKELKAKAYR